VIDQLEYMEGDSTLHHQLTMLILI